MKKQMSEKEIDHVVILEADDDSKSETPIKVSAKKQVGLKNGVNNPTTNCSKKVKVRRPASLR